MENIVQGMVSVLVLEKNAWTELVGAVMVMAFSTTTMVRAHAKYALLANIAQAELLVKIVRLAHTRRQLELHLVPAVRLAQ